MRKSFETKESGRDAGWITRVQKQKVLRKPREDGAAARLPQEPSTQKKSSLEQVKEKKRSRPAPCVPQPQSGDTEPLAAMRIVLQKRRGNNPADLGQVPVDSALEKRQANAPRRSWASIVKGTDRDHQTSLKNNKEATKEERREGKVRQQEREETKRENAEEDEDTGGDRLEDNRQLLVLKKKISEMEASNKDLLKKRHEYKNQIRQLRAQVSVLETKAESVEAEGRHRLQRHEQDSTTKPERGHQRIQQLEERAAEVGQKLAGFHTEIQQLEDRNQELSRNVEGSVQRWDQLVQQLHHLTEERLEVETRLQRLREEAQHLRDRCEQLVLKKPNRGLFALFKKFKKNLKKSLKKEKEDGPRF